MKLRFDVATVNGLLIAGHVYFGVGYLLGIPRVFSSRTFTYAVQWFTPETWALAILAGAPLTIIAPWAQRITAWLPGMLHLIAAVPLLGFAVAIFFAEARGMAQGWGGTVLFLVPVVFHARIAAARFMAGKDAA